jgi:hypothetical protein
MGPEAKDVERLLHLLEEVRLLLAGSLLLPPTAPRKKLSWEDVWRVSYWVTKSNAPKRLPSYQDIC